MINEELLKNYKKTLEQKYNAVCFDIDGTLTKNNSKDIDEEALKYIKEILKKHIPVVFITGRGETGLEELKKELEKLIGPEFSKKYFEKVYALTNDGARIFSTDKNTGELFGINNFISKKEDLEKLKELDIELQNIITNNKNLSKYCKITYSKVKDTNEIINIRTQVLIDDQEINDQISEIINLLIKKTKSPNINLTIGMYNGNKIYQIGTAIKSEAIKAAEQIIGIPQDSMLRIGDCGDENGNDFTMLDCPQGFSVDKRSKYNDRCFPIFDENLNILKGVKGTINILKQVKLLPTICLEHANENDYIKEYSYIEKRMTKGKNKRIAEYNNKINTKFDEVDGIYSLYDKFSGSIKIPMYEWNCIDDNNPLKKFWSITESNNKQYSMFDNESLLLRGPKTYYYFLAKRSHDETTGKDITTKDMINEWFKNNQEFYTSALLVLSKEIDLKDINNQKMILGILDNIRNEMLILLNKEIINTSKDKNIILNLEKTNNLMIQKIYKLLVENSNIMSKISFDENYEIKQIEIYKLILESIQVNNQFNNQFNKEEEKENYSKDFRAYREIDNFAENYITSALSIKEDKDIDKNGLCGLSYGGIELPIIMKSIDDKFEDVSILKFNKSVTGYSKKQSLNLRFFDITKVGNIDKIGIDKNKKYILLDDNLLTGKTMQLAITTLYDIGLNTNKIIVVRYPGVNRINQMFMPNHGAIDYKYFLNFIEGLYFPSPYSWRDSKSTNPYEDSLGIFDLNRRKIIECLAKNGEYSNTSEVIYVKRKIKNE